MILDYLKAGSVDVVNAFVAVLPYTLPLAIAIVFWKLWIEYIEYLFALKAEWVLLEIKLPKETYKSPKAMEVVLNSFYQKTDPNWYEAWWEGKIRMWSSLEMVSIDGNVHFFIRIISKLKNTVESHIYSQFPGIEVHEVKDYVFGVPYLTSDEWQLHGSEYKLAKEDAYPIKTYIDYGMEKDPIDEMYRIDPMTATLEFLGSLGPGEQVWIQILIMAAKKRFKKKGTLFETLFEKGEWKDEAKAIVDKMMKRDKKSEEKTFGSLALSPGERSAVEAVERSVSKLGFDTGIRVIYVAKKEKFDPARVVSLGGVFRQYNTLNLNSFKATRSASFDWWEDPIGFRLPRRKRKLFLGYCERGYFYRPHSRKPFVLNTEELATIYHFPGQVAEVPTFSRIESKKSEPPANLPI